MNVQAATRLLTAVAVVLVGWPATPALAAQLTGTVPRPYDSTYATCSHTNVGTCTATADAGTGEVSLTASVPEVATVHQGERASSYAAIDLSFTVTSRARRVAFVPVYTRYDLGSAQTGQGEGRTSIQFEPGFSCNGCSATPGTDGITFLPSDGSWIPPQTLRFRLVTLAVAVVAAKSYICLGTCAPSGVSIVVGGPATGSAEAHVQLTIDRLTATIDQ